MARKYARDNRGRFAPKGAGATARGGRLKTASGKKRATQTMQAGGAKPSGAIKGRVKRDLGAAGKIGKAKPAAAAARLKRSGKKIKVTQKKAPTPTKEDKSIEKIRALKVAEPAFGRGSSRALFIPETALTPSRRKALGIRAFASGSESQRWAVSRQQMGSRSGVLISERSSYRASLPKAKQGIIKKPFARKREASSSKQRAQVL